MTVPSPDAQVGDVPPRDLPRVVLEGPPAERGQLHGSVLGDAIDAGLRRWQSALEEHTGRPSQDAITPLVRDTALTDTVRRWAPDELTELEALADAAEQPREVLLAYNLMDEEWWWCRGQGIGTAPQFVAPPPGCSTLAVRSGANGVPLTAQNMDLSTFYGPGRVLLDLRPPDAPQQLLVSFAGFLATMGVSRVPLSVNVNTLMSLRHSTAGLPVAFMVRRLLAQPDLSSAVGFLKAAPHASGQNFLIGSSEGVVDFEASASGLAEWGQGEAAFAHTNHPLVNPHEDPAFPDVAPNSLARMTLTAQAVGTASTLADLEQILSDRTVPVCQIGRASRDTDTFAAIAVEHTSPPKVRIAAGPPTETPFADVEWDP